MVNPLSSILTNIRLFGKNSWSLLFLVLALVLNAAIWMAIFRFGRSSQDFVPLHYSTAIGIDRIGQWHQLLFIPAFGLSAILFNFVLGIVMRRERVVPELLLSSAFLVQIILALASAFLLYNFY